MLILIFVKFFNYFPFFLRILNQNIHFRANLKTEIFDFPEKEANFGENSRENANFEFDSASFLTKFTIFIDLDKNNRL